MEMETIDQTSKYEMVAAIDFGTTYSGYAYSYRYEKETIYVNSNWACGLTLNKVPTAILFNDKKQFVAFGQDAVLKYSQYSECEEEEQYYFFHRFKMSLYQEKCVNSVNRLLTLTAANGKKMKALDVFSAAIEFLKNHLINSVNKRSSANEVDLTAIRWVLTVPAIWSDSAKQFMREAAEKAGIPRSGLVIALEPEAASLYCQTLPEEKLSTQADFNKIGVKYIVLDNGGGTVDVTVHQILENGRIKEVYKATGGAWGGTMVDQAFEEYLTTMLSKGVINEVKKKNPCEWMDMMLDFERIKRTINHDDNDDFKLFMMKPCIREIYRNMYDVDLLAAFQNNINGKGASLRGPNRLKIPKNVISEMIQNVSKSIRAHADELLKKTDIQDSNFIMMVGGFSNSQIVVDDIRDLIAGRIPVIAPEEAELSVVKGAVIFGWKPDIISLRKSRKTYGISMVSNFKEGIDPQRLAFFDDDNNKKCKMVFDKLVSANQDIDTHQVVSRTYFPVYNNQTEMNIILYASDEENVQYCDEVGVAKIGFLVVPMSDVIGNKNRKVSIDVSFGNTEFRIDGRDLTTGKHVNATYDFLTV